jgi:hypothetical protein
VCAFAAEPESIALPRHVLTNDGLIVLARAGLGDGLLVDLVKHKRTQFDTSAEALAQLARQGLSESVIRAVVEKQEQVQLRKPKLTIAPSAGEPLEIEQGDVVMLQGPGNGKRAKSEPDRWYKLSMR